MSITIDFGKYNHLVQSTRPMRVSGYVVRIVGLVIEGIGPEAPVGSVCEIFPEKPFQPLLAEVVGFRDDRVLLMPLGEAQGISPGCRIISKGEQAGILVDETALGRVMNGLGEPIDGKGKLRCQNKRSLYAEPINPFGRRRILEPLDLGIRSINGLVTCGKGQRMGILAGTGVGKSVLLGMIARYTGADVNVIALVGERGREVREFIETNVGEEGMKKSVVVVATSDDPSLIRIRAAFLATTIAEYFRSMGKDVLLMMDSVTRFATALREVGLSIGEPPATKGFTPSVFAALPRLMERAGMSDEGGSITGLYTVLIEGDDLSDPISDATRAILDGHILLSRSLATRSLYPAVDLMNSVSRLMVDVVSPEHMKKAMRFKELYAAYKENEDLINIGAYAKGSSPEIDAAIQKYGSMREYLRQDILDRANLHEAWDELGKVVG